MRMVSYIGTRKSTGSNTLRLLDMLSDKVKSLLNGETLEHKMYYPSNLAQAFCCGCLSCFSKGICPLDKEDGLDEIKKEILLADVIILGSPVYAGTVSADTKCFIDRLSYWCHIMPLIGKYGVPLVTASSNHALETSSYLRHILETWGTSVPVEVTCTDDKPAMLHSEYFHDTTIGIFANKIVSSLKEGSFSPSAFQENFFRAQKQAYCSQNTSINAEYLYWHNHGYTEYSSFADLFKSRIKSKL